MNEDEMQRAREDEQDVGKRKRSDCEKTRSCFAKSTPALHKDQFSRMRCAGVVSKSTRKTPILNGQLFSEDDAGTITERPMLIKKELPSECNDLAEEKPLPTNMPSHVLKFKSVFKCRMCPRIICLTEDTLRDHLQSKRHARSEKLHREGRLKAILNSDGEIENQEVSEIQTEDSEDDTKKTDKGQKQHTKRFRKKKSDNANTRKMRSTKGPAKRRRKK